MKLYIVEGQSVSELLNQLTSVDAGSVAEGRPDVLLLASEKRYLKRLVARNRKKSHVLKLSEISLLGSEDSYAYALHHGAKYYPGETLSQLESALDPESFVRIHRGYLINVDFISTIETESSGRYLVSLDDTQGLKLRTSRAGAERLRNLLFNKNPSSGAHRILAETSTQHPVLPVQQMKM